MWFTCKQQWSRKCPPVKREYMWFTGNQYRWSRVSLHIQVSRVENKVVRIAIQVLESYDLTIQISPSDPTILIIES